MNTKGAKAYLATQVTTTTQGDLLLMLYDAAIKFLKQAKIKIAENNIPQKGILISRAIDIVSELAESLNKDKGGELAQNLNNLYFFCSTRLVKANIKSDLRIIDEVIGILNGLRSAFAQIIPAQEGRPGPASTSLSSPEMEAPAPVVPPRPAAPLLDPMGTPLAAQPATPRPDETALSAPVATPKAAAPKTPPPAAPAGRPGLNLARLRAATAYNSNMG